jgi:hypothetical protein
MISFGKLSDGHEDVGTSYVPGNVEDPSPVIPAGGKIVGGYKVYRYVGHGGEDEQRDNVRPKKNSAFAHESNPSKGAIKECDSSKPPEFVRDIDHEFGDCFNDPVDERAHESDREWSKRNSVRTNGFGFLARASSANVRYLLRVDRLRWKSFTARRLGRV